MMSPVMAAHKEEEEEEEEAIAQQQEEERASAQAAAVAPSSPPLVSTLIGSPNILNWEPSCCQLSGSKLHLTIVPDSC